MTRSGSRQPYPTDLSAEEWQEIESYFVRKDGVGRKRTVDERDIVDAILYIWHCGAPWRMLPHDFPPWHTVYYYYRRWGQDGTLRDLRSCLQQTRQVAW